MGAVASNDDDDDDDGGNNNNNNNNNKGKCTVVPVHATKIYKVNRGVTPLNRNLDAIRWWVVNVTPRLLSSPPLKITPVRIDYKARLVSKPVWEF